VFWLARETGETPEARDLAKDFFQVRAPSIEQIKFAAAMFDGFLMGLKGWNLWPHVGRATRSLPDQMLLQSSLDRLRDPYRKVVAFHQQLEASFVRPVTDHGEFEPARHRAFVNATFDQLLNSVSDVVASTIEENSPSDAACVVAKFRDSILCSGKAKAQLVERIAAKLKATFQSSMFKIGDHDERRQCEQFFHVLVRSKTKRFFAIHDSFKRSARFSRQFSTESFRLCARLCELRENCYRRNTNMTSILSRKRAQL